MIGFNFYITLYYSRMYYIILLYWFALVRYVF